MLDLTLSNGLAIPAIGMGTGWMNTAYKRPHYLLKRLLGEARRKVTGSYSSESNYTVRYELRKLMRFGSAMRHSRRVGYRLYDTAWSYGNCRGMGRSLGFPEGRRDVFIISKCSNLAQREGTVREEFERTLEDLRTNYIDLYLIHWPQTDTFIDAWRVLEDLYSEGRVKAIGVSNFHVHHLEELLTSCHEAPMVDEVECHPLLQQQELRKFCKGMDIRLIAHTATGKMRSGIRESVLADIAVSHGRSIAQVALRWHAQMGDVSICNTLDYAHMAENLDIDFVLSDAEMSLIEDMDVGESARIWPNPDSCDFTRL